MNPVFGPITIVTRSGTVSPKAWQRTQTKYRQARPYNLKLPYRTIKWNSVSSSVGDPWDAGDYGGSLNSPVDFDTTGDPYYSYYTSYENAAITKAISKFNSLQEAHASMGVSMVQHREATEMMVKRTKQIYTVFKSLKRFDLKGASEALGLPLWQARKRHRTWVRAGKRGPYSVSNEDIWSKDWTKTKVRDRARAVSNLWLEFSFGWAPLVDDIETSIKAINDRPFYLTPFKARGSMTLKYKSSSNVSDSSWIYNRVGDHVVKFRVSLGGSLTVTNSNYSLASALGFTNLGLIAYEAVPFSFVANYFFNLENYLQQFSQYDGVTVSQAWYSIVWDDTITYEAKGTYKPTGVTTVHRQYVGSATSMKRVVGSLPTVKLGMRHAYSNGIKRALNNVSLLTQLFIKGK